MSNLEFEINDVSWAEDLEQGLEEYMMGLYEGLDSDDEEPETLSGQPFCGCETCAIRETLSYATPRIIKGFQEGAVKLAE